MQFQCWNRLANCLLIPVCLLPGPHCFKSHPHILSCLLCRQQYQQCFTHLTLPLFPQVSRLDGSHRTALIFTGLSDPRGIAVYPSKGLLFWTDHGGNGRGLVQRAFMDGSRRQSLVRRSNCRGPVGITLDYAEDKVYWADEILKTLWKMDLDGGEGLSIQPFLFWGC